MHRTRLASLAALTLLACTQGPDGSEPPLPELADKATDPVFVVNTTAAPVPTQAVGATTVEGTVMVGNQSLNVNGAVALTNPELMVRQVSTQEPWQHTGGFSIASDSTTADVTFYTVPTGKRLVVEYADGTLSMVAGGTQGLGLQVVEGDADTRFILPLDHGTLGDDLLRDHAQSEYRGAQMMRLYAGPGATIIVHASRNNPVGTASGRLTLAGYLVDAP